MSSFILYLLIQRAYEEQTQQQLCLEQARATRHGLGRHIPPPPPWCANYLRHGKVFGVVQPTVCLFMLRRKAR